MVGKGLSPGAGARRRRDVPELGQRTPAKDDHPSTLGQDVRWFKHDLGARHWARLRQNGRDNPLWLPWLPTRMLAAETNVV